MIRVRLFNDNALEILIAALRIFSVVAALGAVVSAIGAIWSEAGVWERWLAMVALFVALSAGSAYLGWWAFGNANWKGRYRSGGPISGA
jgi:hypothetical protein